MNIIEASSKISGLSQETCKDILSNVKANIKRLELCEGPHDFKPQVEKKMFHKYTCTKCNGEVSADSVHWYSEGLKHGKKGSV